MRCFLAKRDVVAMCSCNKGKNGVSSQFTVTMANGTKKDVNSEQEARAEVRINGGSYTRKK